MIQSQPLLQPNACLKINTQLGLIGNAFNPRVQGADTSGFLEIEEQPGLDSEFQNSHAYVQTLKERKTNK